MAVERIVLLGTGNVATHLARRIVEICPEGSLVQIYGRRPGAASDLALACPYEVAHTHSLSDLYTDATLYLFCLTDTALPSVWSQMPTTDGMWVHMSGSTPLSLQESFHQPSGVIYPLQTFNRERSVEWSSTPIYLESSQESCQSTLEDFARALSGRVYWATSEQRAVLHLGAVLAANFSNHLYALSEKLLQQEGLAPDALYPLLEATLANAKALGAQRAQTGPAIRGDECTMQRHLSLLQGQDALQHLYRVLSQSIGRLGRK